MFETSLHGEDDDGDEDDPFLGGDGDSDDGDGWD